MKFLQYAKPVEEARSESNWKSHEKLCNNFLCNFQQKLQKVMMLLVAAPQ